ncbi:hypothetical protein OAB00_02665 [Akkermansiaceae bacterium]|nr:hypothetical protein [Akkermansiaceae bacterium]
MIILGVCLLGSYFSYPLILGENGFMAGLLYKVRVHQSAERAVLDGDVLRNMPDQEILQKVIISDFPAFCQMHRPISTSNGDSLIYLDIGDKLKPLSISGTKLKVALLDTDVTVEVPISTTNFMQLTTPEVLAR